MISVFSVITGVLWLNVALIIIFFLRKRTTFMVYYSPQLLILIATLALIRILVPLDLKQAYVVRSYHILPAIRDFLQQTLISNLTLWHLLMLFWGVGSWIVLSLEIHALNINRKIYNRIQTVCSEQATRIASETGFTPESVIVSPDISTPMVGGFFSHKVYLPNFDVSDEDLRWILCHEQQHIRNKDSWLKLFYFTLRVILWWNPVIYYFQNELDTILELRCDQSLLAGRTEAEKVAYSEALLHTAQQLQQSITRYPTTVTTFAKACSDSALTSRVKLILNSKPKRPIVNFSIAVLCFALFVTSYLVLFQTAGHGPAVENEIIITADNSYLKHTEDDLYVLWFNGIPLDTYSAEQIDSHPLCDLEIVESDS